MSDLDFNKIAGAVLATGLAITLMNEISQHIFVVDPKVMEECKNCPEPVESGGDSGPAPVTAPPDWGTVLPAADLARGEAVFEKCKSCHKPTDADDTGPGLLGVVGRKPAGHASFDAKYSDAMKEYGAANPQWDYDRLERFLTKPKGEVPGTKMTFTGLKKQEDRVAVIAYLHSLGSSLPIPAPDPSRQAAAPAEGAAAAGAPVPGAAGTAAPAPAKAATQAAPTAASAH
jgi:cytochrome c